MEKRNELLKIKDCFKKYAFKESRGRKKKEKIENMEIFSVIEEEDPFFVDVQKISNCKSFRRLAGKTQVFAFPKDNLTRNRLTHTLEVKSIAETIAKILGLNINLVRAIALGHDLGHTPFGHLGERFITGMVDPKFCHEKYALFVAEKIENDGLGLNLSYEVLKGITYHSNGLNIDYKIPMEYTTVMLSDKFAYLFSDIEDAVRLGEIKRKIPKKINYLGSNREERVNSCIRALCLESYKEGRMSFKTSIEAQIFKLLREWMYQNFYRVLDVRKERRYLQDICQDAIASIEMFLEPNPQKIASIFAIMTDEEARRVALIKQGGTIRDIALLSKMDFWEMTKWCGENSCHKKAVLWRQTIKECLK